MSRLPSFAGARRQQPLLRIAVVCGDRGIAATGQSGASHHLRGICEGFAGLGAEVELWVQRMAAGPQVPAAALPAGVSVLEAPRGRLPGLLRRRVPWDHGADAWAMGRWLQTQARRFDPQLIYERFSLFSSPGLAAARALGVPWVVELNAPLAWEGALFRGLRPSRALLRRESRVLTQADLLVCVSPALRDYALRRGVSPDRIQVLPNGASPPPHLGPRRDPGLARDGANFARDGAKLAREGAKPSPSAPFVLGYAGSFKAWHGLGDALPALHRLRDLVAPRPLELDLWGDGPQRSAFAALVLEERGISLCLRGWGSTSDLARARRSWDAAWVPLAEWPPRQSREGRPLAELCRSFGEPVPASYFCPLKEAEALAQGVPVWRGRLDEAPALAEPPATWQEVAGAILRRSGFTQPSASWDDAIRREPMRA